MTGEVHKRFAPALRFAHAAHMGTAKQISIHAGAHRTGTSTFQMCLHANRAALIDAGFDPAYPGRDGIPSGALSLMLPAPRHGYSKTDRYAARIARAVAQHSPDPARHLILSEENIPGRMLHFQDGAFYPAAEARLTALRAGLGAAQIARLVLVVRSYDDFFRSAYRKRAEDQEVLPFGQVRPALIGTDRGWPELVQAMRDILQPAAFEVVEFARRGASTDLLRRVLPDAPDALQNPEQAMNASASDAALMTLQARYAKGEKLTRAAWRAVLDAHAKDTTPRGFADFTAYEQEELQARYSDDLDRIAALEDVTLTR